MRSGNHLVVTYSPNDTITVLEHFQNVKFRMARFEFANGQIYTMTELLAPFPMTASVTYLLSDAFPQI
jgi:hypothetical protein